MTNSVLNQQLQTIRIQIDEVVKELHELTLQIKHEELAQTVSDLRSRINEPFMFVIVGEVKSGKSSFINALLATGREITKVAPQPMTDTVQQIIYGEEEEVVTVNPYLKKIILPVDILKEIAIVDTPGTNTIVEHHQEITERFIPASDLIVFVFEAKNPYRQSAWDFFDFIHDDWRKKTIFVLQQKDLMPEEDLKVNEQGLEEYAQKKGMDEVVIFSVSAKQEQEGDQANSGFGPLREYIRQNITGGQAPVLKLKNNLDISFNINNRLEEGLITRKKQWHSDIDFREDITQTLEKQKEQSYRQVDMLAENLLAAYDRITAEKEAELKHGLSFFTLLRKSIAGIFSKQASAKEWLESLAKELGTDLESTLREKLNEGVSDLAESIQQMAKLIDLKIQNSETILKNNHAIFSSIAERRSNILQELQDTFAAFLKQTENFTAEELFPQKQPLPSNLATGSGIAVIGAILTTVAQISVLDITGGILTAIGLLFAGVSTSARRRKIIQGFQQEIKKGRERMEGDVGKNLKLYIDRLKKKIEDNFADFDLMLEEEEQQIARLEARQEAISEKLKKMQELVEKLKG